MSPDQQATLRARAQNDPECAAPLAARDCAMLARLLSAGRTRANDREIGYGTILETIGIDAGNRLIDHILSSNDMRHVVPLLAQGRLHIGSSLVQATLRAMGADVIVPAHAEMLCALGLQPDPVTAQQVGLALFHPESTEE